VTRIVAGQAGGRTLRVPPRVTRPTSERVREALFNALDVAGELDGVRVLDLFAGSGALGLEALSRGARDAVFVEADRRAVEILRGNVRAVGLGGTVRHAKAETLVAEPGGEPFDLVLADPPYNLAENRIAMLLTGLAGGGWIAEGGLLVLERALRDGDPEWPVAYTPLRTKRYGDTALHWAEFTARRPR
jgi:16S rRNA (guanine966-N2)-methyltransferase